MYHVPVSLSADREPDRSNRWATAGGVALLAAVYAPGIFGDKVLFLRDIGSHQMGWRLLWARTVLSGHLPLWDPLTLGGTALAGNPNTMALYPFTALFLLFRPPVALALFLFLHHLLLALGTAHLLRRLGFSGTPLLAGVVAVAGSGLAFSQAAFMAGPSTLAWIPFLLASAVAWPTGERAIRRRIAEAAVTGALLVLVGKPELIVLSWISWFVILLRQGPRRTAPALVSVALAAMLAAPLLLATLPVARASWRNAAGAPETAVAADALAPRRWPEFLLPRLHGLPAPELPGGFWSRPSFPWIRYELDLHLGTLPLLLLLLALRRREARPWLAAAGVLVLLAAVPQVTVFLRRLLPPLRLFRYAIKDLLPAVVLAAPAVAAGTLAALGDARALRRAALLLGGLLAPLGLLVVSPPLLAKVLGALYPASAANLTVPGVVDAIAGNLTIDLAVAILPLVAVVWSPRRLLVPVMAIQLVLGGIWVVRWDRWSVWETPPPAVQAMGAGTVLLDHLAFQAREPLRAVDPRTVVRDHFRQLRSSLATHYGTLWGLAYHGASGPDGAEPAWMHLLAARIAGAGSLEAARAGRHIGARWLLTDEPLPPDSCWSRSLPLDGSFPGTAAFELVPVLPRAWCAAELLTVPSDEALWLQLTDPDTVPGRTAVLLGAHSGIVRAGGQCSVEASRPGRWRLTVVSERPTVVVLDEAWSDQWRARLSGGRPLPTVRVNGFLLGVRIPPGRHTVELAIDARPLLVGLGLAAAGLVLTVLLALGVPTRGPRPPNGGVEPTLRANPPAP